MKKKLKRAIMMFTWKNISEVKISRIKFKDVPEVRPKMMEC